MLYNGAMKRRVNQRQAMEGGTWIDPESVAYPSGSLSAGRRCKAVCPDGKTRVCRIGLPDTFFSIPARTRYGGEMRRGFVIIDDGVVTFYPNGNTPGWKRWVNGDV